MIDWASVAVSAASNMTSEAVNAANVNSAPVTLTVPPKPVVSVPMRPAPVPPVAVSDRRATTVPTPPARVTDPVPSFFQLFEGHGLDGLIPEDWDEATRLWLGAERWRENF